MYDEDQQTSMSDDIELKDDDMVEDGEEEKINLGDEPEQYEEEEEDSEETYMSALMNPYEEYNY